VKKLILLTALILCSAYLSAVNGEEKEPKTGGPFEVELEKPASKNKIAPKDIPSSKYWMCVPEEYISYRSWPIMVLLHGAGDTAENFIRSFVDEGKNNGYILVAVKSQGQAWSPNDEKTILETIEQVRKKYNIDPERMFLSGFSSGGFMTCIFGFKNHTIFRGIAPIGAAGMGGDKKAAEHLAVLIVCGDKDPNYPFCTQAYESLKKQKFDTEFHIMPGLGHTFDNSAITWLFDKFQERFNKPDELLKRGKKASSDKRYLDAIDCFNKIIEDKKDNEKEDKIITQAKEELKKIDKISSDKYDQALKKLDSNKKDEGVKLLREVVTQFEGTSVWEKAKEKLNEIEPIENKPAEKEPNR
jgi:predicted esterase